MKLVDLRPLSETLQVRRLLWLREQPFWEHENMKPSSCSEALVDHFEWESEPHVTAEGGLGTSAPTLLRLLFMDLEEAGLRPFLPGWQGRVMEAFREDSERAARSIKFVSS